MNLWEHQQKVVNEHSLDEAFALFWHPRVGKTRAVCAQLDKAFPNRAYCRVLVVAPKTVCSNVWVPELAEWGHNVTDLSNGTLVKRKDAIRNATTIVMNIDAVGPCVNELIRWGPDAIVVDESHLIKSASAVRSRALHRLGRKAKWRRILTGTPNPQSYIDFYSQYKFLAPNIFTTKNEFINRYCDMHHMFPNKVLGYRNLPELQSKIFSLASRVRREDCFDVPHVQEIERSIPLSGKTRTLYNALVAEEILTTEQNGIEVSGENRLTRLLRFRQLTAGFLRDELTNEIMWQHTGKTDAVVAEVGDIFEAGQKAVVFYQFKPEGDALVAALKATYGDKSVAKLAGDTPGPFREAIIHNFNRCKEPQVVVVQEQVGSLGISLKAADYAIFTSCGLDYAAHTQARDRIFADKSQKPRGLSYIYLRCPGTVDHFVKQVLDTKGSASTMMLDRKFSDILKGS